jgi:GNAT superfamily N-acetyltransferase
MNIQIRECDFKSFFRAPYAVYPASVPFVSQLDDELKGLLDPRKNPMLRSGALEITYFTAHDSAGKILGRITAHLHPGSQRHFEGKTGFFGYLDCADDERVAQALVGAAESWARSRGCVRLIGNFNFLATQMMGVLEEGFDRTPYVAMNFGGPAIPVLLQKLGYSRRFPMTTFEVDLASLTDEQLADSRQRENLAGFRWEKATKRDLPRILEEIRVVMNDAFERNPFFAPLTKEEFWFQAKDLSFILDPEITALAYAADGSLAGAVVTIPDINTMLQRTGSKIGLSTLWELPRFKLKRGRALALFAAVRKDLHSLGLGWTLTAQVMRQLRSRGYQTLGVTWVSDENRASQALVRHVGGKPYHRLALYERML